MTGGTPANGRIAGLPRAFVFGVLGLALIVYWFVGTAIACEIDGTFYYGMTDEQYISLRYARNLAHGHGLVWNAGEAPVEGYTNFLWAVWMSVGHLLRIPETHIPLWVVGSSAACLVGASLFSACIANRLRPDSLIAPGVALVVCAFYFPAMRWSLTGFEVGALACTCAGALYYALGPRPGESRMRPLLLCCAIGVLIRLDAAIWIAACCGVAFFEADRAKRKALILNVAIPLGAVVALFTAWRVATYGEWLPNTYVLKATGVSASVRLDQGMGFVGDAVQSHLVMFVFPVALAFAHRDETQRWSRLGVFSVWAAQLAYTLWIGGDTWEEKNFANRPLTIASPALFALLGVGFANAAEWMTEQRGRRLAWTVCAAVLATTMWSHSYRNAKLWLKFDHCRAPLMKKVRSALEIRALVPPDTRIAVVWAGVIPYYTGLPSIDLLGKSDPVIARTKPRGTRSGHNKWDYKYSISELDPDLITSLYHATPADRAYVKSLGYRKDAKGRWWHKRLEARGVKIPEGKAAKSAFDPKKKKKKKKAQPKN